MNCGAMYLCMQCMYVCMYVCLHVCMCVCMCVCMHVCMCGACLLVCFLVLSFDTYLLAWYLFGGCVLIVDRWLLHTALVFVEVTSWCLSVSWLLLLVVSCVLRWCAPFASCWHVMLSVVVCGYSVCLCCVAWVCCGCGVLMDIGAYVPRVYGPMGLWA